MFTTPCFIRKNTPELKKKLEELGYKMNLIYLPNEHNLYIGSGVYSSANFIDNYYLDCGTNEELFLALAALRDDTDKNQWLTDGKIWGKFGEDSFLNPIQIISYLQSKGHKATVEEIMEHFK